MEEFKNLLLFVTMFSVGVILEVIIAEGYYYFTKKRINLNHYSFNKYIFLFLFPLIGLVLLATRVGISAYLVFGLFAITGTLLELLIGFGYHMVVGQRLWTYHRYSIAKYTSILSLPVWGCIGVIFWLLLKLLAL
jgi:hypothetical protein